MQRRAALSLTGAVAVIAVAAASAMASALPTVSPLNGTPDASPYTQISFLGVPAAEISHVSVVGSHTGAHSGRLMAYATEPGASFLPAHPFSQGEQVSVNAQIGRRGHTSTVHSAFEVAVLGSYPLTFTHPVKLSRAGLVQSFHSQPGLQPPTVLVKANNLAAAQGDLFLTPTHGYGQSGAMILDSAGRLLWFHPAPAGEMAANLQVQSFRGQPVLVWWQGHIAGELGIGFGTDEIFSQSYAPLARVSAGNGYQADLHDIQLTPQGSAFITAYTLVRADLSSVGGSRYGTLQDGLLEEIDVPTGLVMFEWHADGHVALQDSYASLPSSAERPWDFFHINSISFDPWGDGNFIVSSRNTWADYEIDHQSGAVLWRLGGRRSTFSMGPGTGTAWQHDARWQSDHTLTLFDDGATPKVHSQSRVIRERIDWRHRRVMIVGRDVHSGPLLAGSQGNDQVLPNGDSFVGWGEQPYFTEFGPGGETLFDAHIPAPGQSYRAYRFPWSATPTTRPAVAVNGSSGTSAAVYASWNGATSVAAWTVLGGATEGSLAPLGARTPVGGFETAIPLSAAPPYLAVQALDSEGRVLGTSPVVPG